jgi:hypothetical protein
VNVGFGTETPEPKRISERHEGRFALVLLSNDEGVGTVHRRGNQLINSVDAGERRFLTRHLTYGKRLPRSQVNEEIDPQWLTIGSSSGTWLMDHGLTDSHAEKNGSSVQRDLTEIESRYSAFYVQGISDTVRRDDLSTPDHVSFKHTLTSGVFRIWIWSVVVARAEKGTTDDHQWSLIVKQFPTHRSEL